MRIHWKYIRYYVCTIFSRQWSIFNIFSCDQAALRTLLSVCPSVCLFVCQLSVRLWHLFHNVPVIVSSWIFQELLPLTKVVSMKRSRSEVKVAEVKTQPSRFRTVTLVWIHIWWWMMQKAWCCIGEVPCCFSQSSIKFQGHTAKKNRRFFYPNLAFSDCNFKFINGYKMILKAWSSIEKGP